MTSTAAAVQDLPVAIRRADVLAFLGYPADRWPSARVERLLDEVLPEARALVRARGAWLELATARAAEVGLEAIEARGLAVGLCTVGPALEARAAELLARGEHTRALLFDAAGSAAAEEAADWLGARVGGDAAQGDAAWGDAVRADAEAAERGATDAVRGDAARGGAERADAAAPIECRLSPGYGRWPLEAQRELFALLPHAAVGVTLSASMMMTPRKSISFAMWLGAVGRPAQGLAGCARCGLDTCRYRRAPRTEERP